MLIYPDIDPVAIDLGPIQVHWYGLMYLFAFAAGWWLGRGRAKNSAGHWSVEQVDDIVFYVAMGVIFGGRLGYVVFYDFTGFLDDPIVIVKVWQGGMSFHGGLIGVMVAMAWYAKATKRGFFAVADFIAPLIPPGLGAGRLGNFINGNLWGKESDLPWAMVFPGAGAMPRHPSQLYQGLLEGLVLFVLLWWFSSRPRPVRAVSGLFLMAYGVFRWLVEFVRIPDGHIGYLAFDWLTMGQVLTLPMVVAGAVLVGLAYRKPLPEAPAGSAPKMVSPGRARKKRKRR